LKTAWGQADRHSGNTAKVEAAAATGGISSSSSNSSNKRHQGQQKSSALTDGTVRTVQA
jgi:hypothetical protein